MNKQEYIDWLKKVRNNQKEHSDMWRLVDEIIYESKKLEEPETLSQEWINRHTDKFVSNWDLRFVSTKDLQNLLVPSKRDQLEEAYEDIMSRKEFWFDGKQYKVVEVSKEETVVSVLNDFYKALERAKKVLSMEVDTNG